jgi:hypothetical protein
MHFDPLTPVAYRVRSKYRSHQCGVVVSLVLDDDDGPAQRVEAERVLWNLRRAIGRGFVVETGEGADLWLWDRPGSSAMDVLAEVAEGLAERVEEMA